MNNYIPFRDIITIIDNMCRDGVTGSIFVTTDENHSACFMLKDGEIISLICRGRRGEKALNIMRKINAGRYRFSDDDLSLLKDDLPTTREILNRLQNDSNGINYAPPSSHLSKAQQLKFEQSLTAFIGPMAAIVCEDCFAEETDLTTAIEMVIKEIPSFQQAEDFRQQITALLG